MADINREDAGPASYEPINADERARGLAFEREYAAHLAAHPYPPSRLALHDELMELLNSGAINDPSGADRIHELESVLGLPVGREWR